MSQENVEIVRRLFGDLSRGDLTAAAGHLSAEVEWDTNARGADGSIAHGRGAVISGIREWLEVWEDPSFDVVDVRDAGDRVAAHARQSARGRGSGFQGDVNAFATYTFADGKIAAYREYPTWSDAVKAVGLEV
jgi:ketosteroid isomerase-like protein